MQNQESLPAPGIGRVLRKGFADVYDYLGLVLASSFIWLVGSLLPVTLGIELSRRTGFPAAAVFGGLLSLITAAALGAGLFHIAYKVVYREDPGIGDLFIGFRRLFLPSISLALTDLIITGILAVDIGFFFGAFRVSRAFAGNPVFFAVGVVFIWITVFWLMTALYHPGLLIASYFLRELEVRRPSIPSILKRGLLLAAASPFFTLIFLFAIIAVTILCVFSRIGMAFFVIYPGIVAVILTHATRALFIKYGVIEERPEIVEDKGWPQGK